MLTEYAGGIPLEKLKSYATFTNCTLIFPIFGSFKLTPSALNFKLYFMC